LTSPIIKTLLYPELFGTAADALFQAQARPSRLED
jgi:hypothetical protein